jgi:hypothetical protein
MCEVGDADGGHMCVGWQQVACTEREFDLNELKVQPHRPMLEAMASSVFCLILPGNSQSSQRLTEAFLTGCIPVFLGPPWHTLPFAHEARPQCLCLYADYNMLVTFYAFFSKLAMCWVIA